MKFVAKISILILVFILLLLFQSNHFFEIGGIVPNLLLIGFIILSLERKRDLFFLFFIGITLILVSFLWFPYWVLGIIIIFIFGIILNLLDKFLSGNIFIDFFLIIILSTLIFYLIFYFIGSGFFVWPIILGEVFYNLILGELFLIFFNRFSKN